MGRDGELAGRLERDADVVDADRRHAVVLERELQLEELPGVHQLELHAGGGVGGEVAAAPLGDHELGRGAEVLGDLAKAVAQRDHPGDERRRDRQQAIIEVAGDQRARAAERVLDGALAQPVDDLLVDELDRIVGVVRRRDDHVDHGAHLAGQVGGQIELAVQRERSLRGGRGRLGGVAVAGRVVGEVLLGGIRGATCEGAGQRESEGEFCTVEHHGEVFRRGGRGGRGEEGKQTAGWTRPGKCSARATSGLASLRGKSRTCR